MKNRIRAAWAALRGRPVVYRATTSGIVLQGRGGFIGESVIDGAAFKTEEGPNAVR